MSTNKILSSRDLNLTVNPEARHGDDGGTESIRGLVRPDHDGSADHVVVHLVNDGVLAKEGIERALLSIRVPGDVARGEAFFAGIANAFINYPLSVEAMLFGWWVQPLEEYEGEVVELTPEQYSELEAVFG